VPTMLEIARIVAGIALIPLILAVAAGLSPLGRQQLRRLNGTAAVDDRYLKVAAYLLVAAVCLSCVAAFLAISGFFTV
jgi:hypothetical protein